MSAAQVDQRCLDIARQNVLTAHLWTLAKALAAKLVEGALCSAGGIFHRKPCTSGRAHGLGADPDESGDLLHHVAGRCELPDSILAARWVSGIHGLHKIAVVPEILLESRSELLLLIGRKAGARRTDAVCQDGCSRDEQGKCEQKCTHGASVRPARAGGQA